MPKNLHGSQHFRLIGDGHAPIGLDDDDGKVAIGEDLSVSQNCQEYDKK